MKQGKIQSQHWKRHDPTMLITIPDEYQFADSRIQAFSRTSVTNFGAVGDHVKTETRRKF